MDEQVTNPQGSEPQASPEERFEALLDAESSQEPNEAEVKAEDNVDEEVDEEVSQEASEEESYDEVEEDETEESEEDEPEVETVTHYKVKANGEEHEVSVDELIKSYQLGTDYTKKTQALAEQRKELEAEAAKVKESVELGQVYAQRLKQLEDVLSSDADSNEDLAELRENDPIQYAIKVAEQTENKKKLEAVRQEQLRVAQQQQAYRQQALSQHIQSEAIKMAELIPEFSDKTKGEQLKNEIRNFGKSIGFNDDELAQVYDSRHVNVLYKAMKYDRLMKNKAKVTKKVADAPTMAKSKARVPDTKSQAYRNQRKALRESGSSEAAQSVFESILSQ
jgi:hypothetical protein